MCFQCNMYLLPGRMETRRHAELDVGIEWQGVLAGGWVQCPLRTTPRAREGRGGRAGAVPAAWCPCAGERPRRTGCAARGAVSLRLRKAMIDGVRCSQRASARWNRPQRAKRKGKHPVFFFKNEEAVKRANYWHVRQRRVRTDERTPFTEHFQLKRLDKPNQIQQDT